MTVEDARERIQSSIDRYGVHAAAALDLVINEVRSSLGHEAANELIDEFDLELQYNILRPDSQGGNF